MISDNPPPQPPAVSRSGDLTTLCMRCSGRMPFTVAGTGLCDGCRSGLAAAEKLCREDAPAVRAWHPLTPDNCLQPQHGRHLDLPAFWPHFHWPGALLHVVPEGPCVIVTDTHHCTTVFLLPNRAALGLTEGETSHPVRFKTNGGGVQFAWLIVRTEDFQ